MEKEQSNIFQKAITTILTIISVIVLVLVGAFIGLIALFNYAFNEERAPNPNYNPTDIMNERYDINIPEDTEITYRAYDVWTGFSGDGTTYCIYNTSNTDINVNWVENKSLEFETTVDKILDHLSANEELLDYDAYFKLEHRFDWNKQYKWFSKVKPWSKTEYIENTIISESLSEELYLFYVEDLNQLFLVESNL